MEWSTNSSSQHCHKVLLPLLMSLISTCTGERSRRFSAMKTKSKILIVGFLRPSMDRRFGKFCEPGMWNLRLELGHRLRPTPVRTTEMAPAQAVGPRPSPEKGCHEPDQTGGNAVNTAPCAGVPQESSCEKPAPPIYRPAEFACTKRAGKFAATDFQPQPDGTLRCPAGHPLYAEACRASA
jgi:hypothetical protein